MSSYYDILLLDLHQNPEKINKLSLMRQEFEKAGFTTSIFIQRSEDLDQKINEINQLCDCCLVIIMILSEESCNNSFTWWSEIMEKTDFIQTEISNNNLTNRLIFLKFKNCLENIPFISLTRSLADISVIDFEPTSFTITSSNPPIVNEITREYVDQQIFWDLEEMDRLYSELDSRLRILRSENAPPPYTESAEIEILTNPNWTYKGQVTKSLTNSNSTTIKIPHGQGTKTYKSGMTHNGTFKNGQAHGPGIRIWSRNRASFCGNFTNGKLSFGTYSWQTGAWYAGEFLNNKRHGNGTFRFASGETYQGEWDRDFRHGFGSYNYNNGEKYTGQYQNNKRHGQGRILDSNNNQRIVYEGSWQNDKMSGFGKYCYSSGDVYEGYWSNNQKHGQGTFTTANGATYFGNFHQDFQHGHGHYKYENGDSYKGMFDKGIKQGLGVYIYNNGDEYHGEWQNNFKSGKGVFYYKNGNYYEGQFSNGKMHGRGRLTSADGNFCDGIFVDNQMREEIAVAAREEVIGDHEEAFEDPKSNEIARIVHK